MAVLLSDFDWLVFEEIGSCGGYRKKSVHRRVSSRYLCFEKSKYDLTLWIQYQQQKHRPAMALPTMLPQGFQHVKAASHSTN